LLEMATPSTLWGLVACFALATAAPLVLMEPSVEEKVGMNFAQISGSLASGMLKIAEDFLSPISESSSSSSSTASPSSNTSSTLGDPGESLPGLPPGTSGVSILSQLESRWEQPFANAVGGGVTSELARVCVPEGDDTCTYEGMEAIAVIQEEERGSRDDTSEREPKNANDAGAQLQGRTKNQDETADEHSGFSLGAMKAGLCFGSKCSRLREEEGRANENLSQESDGLVLEEVGPLRTYSGLSYIRSHRRDRPHAFEVSRGFPTIIPDSNGYVASGRGYYELVIEKGTSLQVGWLRRGDFNGDGSYTGVGDDGASWGFDGARMGAWHFEMMTPYGEAWKEGDVVGSGYDAEKGEIWFSLNGRFLGTAFSYVYPRDGLTPAATVEGDEGTRGYFVFQEPKYLPPDYRAVVFQPRESANGRRHRRGGSRMSVLDVLPHVLRGVPGAASGVADGTDGGWEDRLEMFGGVRRISKVRVQYTPNGKWGAAVGTQALKPHPRSSSIIYFEATFRVAPRTHPASSASSSSTCSPSPTTPEGLSLTQQYASAGLVAGRDHLRGEPGFEGNSYAYLSDGSLFFGNGERFGEEQNTESLKWSVQWGEVTVGLGVDIATGTVFITRDGRFSDTAWQNIVIQPFRPAIAFHESRSIVASIETDASRFLYNITHHHATEAYAKAVFEYFDLDNNAGLSRKEFTCLHSLLRTSNTYRVPVSDATWRAAVRRRRDLNLLPRTLAAASAVGARGSDAGRAEETLDMAFPQFLYAYRKAHGGKVVHDHLINVHNAIAKHLEPIVRHFDRNNDHFLSRTEHAALQTTVRSLAPFVPALQDHAWLCEDVIMAKWDVVCDLFGVNPATGFNDEKLVRACAHGYALGKTDHRAFWSGMDAAEARAKEIRRVEAKAQRELYPIRINAASFSLVL